MLHHESVSVLSNVLATNVSVSCPESTFHTMNALQWYAIVVKEALLV